MDLNELQSVRDRERHSDKLQQLRESFYGDVGEFIQQLKAERERAAERADDPFDSPEVNRLTDEINTAKQTVEAIYDRRVGKLVKAASFTAADQPIEIDGMTCEEQELFDQLVGNIKANRNHVIDVLDGEADTGATAPTDSAQAAEPAPEPTPPANEQPQASVAGEQPTQAERAPSPVESEPPAPAEASSEKPAPAAPSGDDGMSAADMMGGGDDGNESPAPVGQSPASTTEESQPPVDGSGGGTDPQPPDGDTRSDPPIRNDGGTDTDRQDADPTGATADQHRASSHESTTGGSRSSTTADAAGVTRQRVRIDDDVETFVGSDDRDYDLVENDVVTLPETNADVLLERGVAQKLE